MKKKKRSLFITNLFNSITNFDYYKKISTEKISNGIKYFIQIVIIYAIIATIGMIYNMYTGVNEIKEFITSEISELNYSNGILTVNNGEYKSFFNNSLVVDTSKENIEEYENNSNIVLGKEYCTIKMDDHIFKIRYNDYFYEDINKDDIIKFLSNQKYYVMFSIIIFIWTTIILAISTIMDVLIIALVGLIMSKIIGNNEMKFSNMFNMAIHAITLPVVLSMIYYLVNVFIGFYIKYFSIMYTSIATIYMMTSILLITIDKNKDNNIQDN